MIYSLSNYIAIRIKNNLYINDNETEVIAYGLFSIFSKIIYAIICGIFSILFNCAIEGVFFYTSFLFIKKYSGGFHSKTEIRCFFLSTISIFLSVFLASLSKKAPTIGLILVAISFVSYFIIYFFSPVPAKEKPLTLKESKNYSIKARVRLLIVFAVNVLLIVITIQKSFIAINIAVILESILLVMGKLSNRKFNALNKKCAVLP